mgnify:FL=1|tara:strand:- start:351 stop:518 length:168 start_codon:yes stop_codon:yes gene_type:complete
MKLILEALEFCKENDLYDKHINIALGINKIPSTIKEGLYQVKIRNKRIEQWQKEK